MENTNNSNNKFNEQNFVYVQAVFDYDTERYPESIEILRFDGRRLKYNPLFKGEYSLKILKNKFEELTGVVPDNIVFEVIYEGGGKDSFLVDINNGLIIDQTISPKWDS